MLVYLFLPSSTLLSFTNTSLHFPALFPLSHPLLYPLHYSHCPFPSLFLLPGPRSASLSLWIREDKVKKREGDMGKWQREREMWGKEWMLMMGSQKGNMRNGVYHLNKGLWEALKHPSPSHPPEFPLNAWFLQVTGQAGQNLGPVLNSCFIKWKLCSSAHEPESRTKPRGTWAAEMTLESVQYHMLVPGFSCPQEALRIS